MAWDFQQCMCDQQSLRSACAYAQSDQSLCKALEHTMILKLFTEQHLEFLILNRGCTGLSESTLVEMPHCWKSHVTAHLVWTKNEIAWGHYNESALSALFLLNKAVVHGKGMIKFGDLIFKRIEYLNL